MTITSVVTAGNMIAIAMPYLRENVKRAAKNLWENTISLGQSIKACANMKRIGDGAGIRPTIRT